MRRADRLFQIVQHLRAGRLVTAADLQSTGVPIEGEAGVGYVMREGFDLPPLMFTREEVVALVAGARIVRAWGGAAMARAAEEALVKIEAVLPDDARARARAVPVHAAAWDMDDRLRARIDEIEAAVSRRRWRRGGGS